LEYYLQAQEQIKFRTYKNALSPLSKAIEIESNFVAAFSSRGYCYFMMKDFVSAKPDFEKVLSLKPDDKDLFYYLGEIYFENGDYQKAKEFLSKFLAKGNSIEKYTTKAKTDVAKAEWAAEALKNPVEFKPENLGDAINSSGHEYMPFLTADDGMLFFTSRREGCTGGYASMYQDFTEDFYFAVKVNNQWQKAENLGAPVNTVENEGAACFSPDGNWVYFTACNRSREGGCDIWFSRRENGKWIDPQPVPNINSRFYESYPCLSPDGNVLYFSSAREGGSGGADIWFSTKVNNVWQRPENLGKTINSPGNEYAPFLHADGQTFYFSSDFHLGFGGMDLFLSRKNGSNFGTPVNLGYPINTNGDETNIFVNTAGNKAFMNSSRAGGKGKNDIYQFDLDPKIKPILSTFVRGVVSDAKTQNKLDAEVIFIDLESKDTVRKVSTAAVDGKFLLSLSSGKRYAASVKKNGYLFNSQNFDLKEMTGDQYFDLNILLSPIEKGSIMVLKNVFYQTNSYELTPDSYVELEQTARFLLENPKIVVEISGHTDDVGDNQYNQTLSEKRANSVRDYLITKGLPKNRILAKGYGETKPMVPNENDRNRALNRRTEMTIVSSLE